MSLKTRQIEHYTLVYDDEESEFANLIGGEWELNPNGQIAWLYDDHDSRTAIAHWDGTGRHVTPAGLDLGVDGWAAVTVAELMLPEMRGDLHVAFGKTALGWRTGEAA